MFTELYLKTTDPSKPLSKVLRENMQSIFVSVIFHTIIYTGAFNLASFVFLNRWLSYYVNVRLSVALIAIMFFGYIGRYYHIKDIYKAYGENKQKTREHIDKLYIGWIFIG